MKNIKKLKLLLQKFTNQARKAIFFLKRLTNKCLAYLNLKSQIFKKINLILKIILIVYILFICLSRLNEMYNIPVDKPYYVGTWDEPSAINAGINFLRTKGDAIYYNYGGTCVIPNAIIFYLYCKKNNIEPYYKFFDKKFDYAHWPWHRKIYPVKPIFIAKVVAIVLFTIGIFIFVSFFSWYLLPIPFLLLSMIDHSSILAFYAPQMLTETHITLLAGITCIFFILALITKDTKKFIKYLLVCCTFSSLTIASKMYTAWIIVLPLSLVFYLYKNHNFPLLSNKRTLLKIAALLTIPYLIINPAVFLKTPKYIQWIKANLEYSTRAPGTLPFSWISNSHIIREIATFVNDLYLIKLIPAGILILLFIGTSILMIRISKIAFASFIFFHFYSFNVIVNQRLPVYNRHFVFMLLTYFLFFLFPFIYYYKKAPYFIKSFVILTSLVITVSIYPVKTICTDMTNLFNSKFTNNWTRESRDEFSEYVKSNNLTVYFYDYHHFSLPNDIRDKIIPFSDIEAVPKKLGKNQIIGLIQYIPATENRLDWGKIYNNVIKYNTVVKYLKETYRFHKIIGPKEGNYTMWNLSPISNPSILLLK